MRGMSRVNVDRLGAIAGTACAIHCALSGVALGLLSTVGMGFLASETSEVVFLTVTLSLGSFAVVQGFRKHRSLWPTVLFVIGLFFIVLGHQVGGGHDHHGHSHSNPFSWMLSVAGASSLVVFHVLNKRLSHKCSCTNPACTVE